MGIDNFPIGDFIFLVAAFFIISFGISLLIAAAFSEDKEHGILAQMWATFFGSDNVEPPENSETSSVDQPPSDPPSS